MTCNRCGGTGFLNLEQAPDGVLEAFDATGDPDVVMVWVTWAPRFGVDHDVEVCDCCGDGEVWHGEPGQHYAGESMGTYSYNGGLPECA